VVDARFDVAATRHAGLTRTKDIPMNTKLAAIYAVAGALLLPVAASAADVAANEATAKTYVKDSVITTKVKADLAGAKMESLIHISVDTDSKGMVTLSGTAPTQGASDRAATIAGRVEGVTSVDNRIQVVAVK
jgi:hyperosmotically inducible protein